MYRLLLVDDHVLFREGMRSVMSRWDDIMVVGEAANGEDAVAAARALSPDIVLMDIGLPGMDGIRATRLITEDSPSTRVVMLTMSEGEEDLFEAIRNGAAGYMLKNTPSRRLHDELRGLLRGEAPLSGSVAAKILKEFKALQSPSQLTPAQQSRAADMDALSDRERQVLRLLADGLSNAEIGKKLCLSENTVKKYMHTLLQKLHLENRVEAATYALRALLAAH
jgi:DNA-binding NarL/FixJ family response regulator